MKSILEELAHGNISPDTRYFKRDSQYAKLLEALSKKEEKLLSALKEPEKELYEDLSDAQMELNDVSEVDKFIYGYRLGMLTMMEVLSGKEELLLKALEIEPK